MLLPEEESTYSDMVFSALSMPPCAPVQTPAVASAAGAVIACCSLAVHQRSAPLEDGVIVGRFMAVPGPAPTEDTSLSKTAIPPATVNSSAQAAAACAVPVQVAVIVAWGFDTTIKYAIAVNESLVGDLGDIVYTLLFPSLTLRALIADPPQVIPKHTTFPTFGVLARVTATLFPEAVAPLAPWR